MDGRADDDDPQSDEIDDRSDPDPLNATAADEVREPPAVRAVLPVAPPARHAAIALLFLTFNTQPPRCYLTPNTQPPRRYLTADFRVPVGLTWLTDMQSLASHAPGPPRARLVHSH